MKKIVGIIAAVAMATSVFAADISAGTKINGKLFSYDNAKKLSLFSEGNDSHDYANPNFVFGISGDKAGASLKITTDGGTLNPKQTTQTIWFKPFDALKITAGNYDVALNKEQIDWTESVTGLGGEGILISFNTNGFGLDIGMNGNNNGGFWLEKEDKEGAKATMKNLFVKAGYGADFGNIGAYVSFNKTYADWEYRANFMVDQKDDTVKSIDFGAGYQNNFNGVNMFVNVVGNMGKTFEWLRPEIFVSGSVDAFGYALFAAPLIWTNSDLKKDTECELTVKVSYTIDGVTPYVYFNDKNLMAKNFESTIKLGAQGSCGSMGWNTWFQIDTGKGDKKDKVDLSIPFELSISF
jgi:hypothetical protein